MTDTGQKPRDQASGGQERSQRRITSGELLGGEREVIILHGADEYRLRLTSNAKLILTK